MDRSSRSRKTVNYSELMHSDDEDFATVRAPPNKKARSFKEHHRENDIGTPTNSSKEIVDLTDERCRERVSLDDKLYKKHLEAALSLSMLQRTSARALDEECLPPVLTDYHDASPNHPLQDIPPILSHCGVDVSCTESDTCFSDPKESDDKYTVTKKVKKEKMCSNEKKTAPKAVKKDKNTSKLPKVKPQSKTSKTVLSLNPGGAQFLPTLKRTPNSPPAPELALCSSPVGGRLRKWNPPGLRGSQPTSFQKTPVKSPGLGLRLGLSRLARLKPLHPNAVANCVSFV